MNWIQQALCSWWEQERCWQSYRTRTLLKPFLLFCPHPQPESVRTAGSGEGAGSSADWQSLVGWTGCCCHRYLGNWGLLYHSSPGLQTWHLYREGTKDPNTGFQCRLHHVTFILLSQLQLFTFTRKDDVRAFLLDHIQCVSKQTHRSSALSAGSGTVYHYRRLVPLSARPGSIFTIKQQVVSSVTNSASLQIASELPQPTSTKKL